MAYGLKLPTGNLDICPAPDPDNLGHLATLLSELHAKPGCVPGFSTEEERENWPP